MEPLLKDGRSVLVSSLPYLISIPKIGDIVACKMPAREKVLIKRVTSVVEGKYFIRGDNQSDSMDSRKFGLVEKKSIIGKVVFY